MLRGRTPFVVLVSGSIATCAMAGALLAMGRRSTAVWAPLNAVASYALGPPSISVRALHPVVTPMAVILLGLMVMVAAFAALTLQRRFRFPGIVAALVVTLFSALFSLVSARFGGLGLGVALLAGDFLVVHLVMMLGLVGGIRFAFSLVRSGGM
jgi:hypothetical protein